MEMVGGIQIFDGEGYEIWSKKMKTLFLSLDLWDLVQHGYEEEGFEENSMIRLRECKIKDAKCLLIIQQGVSNSIFPVIMEAKKSKEAWDAITNKFYMQSLNLVEIDDNETATTRIDQIVSKSRTVYPDERCIFRIPYSLRNGNEKFYEPTVLAIGPYHRGKPRLDSMEEHKIRYLQELLKRTDEQSVDRYVKAVMPEIEKVRKYYVEHIDGVSSDELIQMMVLDGCFIIEFFRRFEMRQNKVKDDDPVVYSDILLLALRKDLLLLENQIPFFILEILFNTINMAHFRMKLKPMILVFFVKRFGNEGWTSKDHDKLFSKNVSHLMDFTHKIACFGFSESSPASSSSNTQNCFFVNSATKLEEANVTLKASLKTKSMFNITFSEGELQIPSFVVDDSSEVEIRNFLAFELCQQAALQRPFCDFAVFMDHLVMSSDDVVLLMRRGIINNNMIDVESVDTMFKRLTNSILVPDPYIYKDISIGLKKYCGRPWNRWSASLKQKYFNSPWAFISFLAASMLLGLTVTQTVFSIISYKVTN
ncbi:UPF0481 protein At3g47200-like [Impatiens glandulifera]|uniref:UPF0481 protein At3g47200-like n=1 Tax=Impatiens glandulifera TaxID=253017 RepID=UPI001FB0E8E9|nr:UPF0481 protein At3g47200-like [Impatiens glandulifera]